MIKKIDHIAVAVASIDEAARFYEGQLGLKVARRETIPERKVRVGFITIGETQIELLEPDSPDSTVAKFLERHGPGLHHICFEVDDAGTELKRLAAAGVKLIDPTPRTGAHGNRVAFLHPEAARGVLIELTQPSSPTERQ